jgi:ribosomal protein S27AE
MVSELLGGQLVHSTSDDFVTVATFARPVEAHLARTKLESEGIPCFVTDEQLVQVNWLFPNVIGGVKLKVPASYAPRAKDILRPRPRLVVVADADAKIPEDELICPRCRSFDVYRHKQRLAAVATALFGSILPWHIRKWVCKQCGYQWKDKS